MLYPLLALLCLLLLSAYLTWWEWKNPSEFPQGSKYLPQSEYPPWQLESRRAQELSLSRLQKAPELQVVEPEQPRIVQEKQQSRQLT